ncbi:MAG: MCP four helix bundle domain-containing protein, partial [Magnetospirillum sp.]|nr:MCP four helix bundle domain-containing protein [Magnetospirillum sp.]
MTDFFKVTNAHTMFAARFFSRFSIGHRIYAGFALVLLLLGLVALVGIIGLGSTSRSFSSYERAADNAVTVSVIDRSVVSILSNVMRYTGSTGDDKALPRIREVQQEIVPLLQEAEAKAGDDKQRDAIRAMAGKVEAYAANIDKLIALKQKRDHIVNEIMLPLGSEAQQRLSGIIRASLDVEDHKGAALAGVAQEGLMQALLNANRFIAKNDPALVEEAKRQVDVFAKAGEALANHIIDPTLLDESYAAGKAGPKYREAFLEMVAAVTDADKLTNQVMAAQAAEIAQLAKDTGLTMRRDLAITTDNTVSHIAWTRWIAVVLAVGAGLLGTFLAWGVASGILNAFGGHFTDETGTKVEF